MTLAIAIALNAVLAVALLGAFAFVMSAPPRFTAPVLALARVPRSRLRACAGLRPSNRPVAVG